MSLVVDSITKRFGDVVALDGASFTAEPGRIFGLLGANGAGQDDLHADRARHPPRRRGHRDLAGAAQHRAAAPHVGLPARGARPLPADDGHRRARASSPRSTACRSAEATGEVEDWLERFRIPDYRDRKVQELSKGNQQKIQFIAAILHDPDVLIMDEPFSGLDPVNVQLLKEAFLEMRDRGKALIFSTHQMETVEELCESIAIIDQGRVVVSGLGARTSSAPWAARSSGWRPMADGTDVDWPGWHMPGVTAHSPRREDYPRAARAGRDRSAARSSTPPWSAASG